MMNLIEYNITENKNNDRIYLTFQDENKVKHTFSFTFDEILNKTKVENKIGQKFNTNQLYNDLYSNVKHCDSYEEFFGMNQGIIINTMIKVFDSKLDVEYYQNILIANSN